jgi:hypothetical protein
MDMFGTYLLATFRDITIANAAFLLKLSQPILAVQGVHVECGDLNHEPRSEIAVLSVMIPKHVTNILAQEAFNTLTKLLDAFHVYLLHFERAGNILGDSEGRYLFRSPVIDRYIRNQVLDEREGLKRMDAN